jgi:hypothetical protein
VSLPTDLLDLAEHLSNRERRRPKQASLRRSVSSSYYALFHLLTSESVSLVGPRLQPPAQRKIQRWFDHGEMKRVCGMFSAAATPKQVNSVLGSPVSNDLQLVARSFANLQEARHGADYDLETVWSRVATQDILQIARDAFSAWTRVRNTHEANVFAMALLSVRLFDRADR